MFILMLFIIKISDFQKNARVIILLTNSNNYIKQIKYSYFFFFLPSLSIKLFFTNARTIAEERQDIECLFMMSFISKISPFTISLI